MAQHQATQIADLRLEREIRQNDHPHHAPVEMSGNELGHAAGVHAPEPPLIDAKAHKARQQLALYRGLADPAAVSRSEVIRAEGEEAAATTRLGLARARLASAQAAAAAARTEIERLVVRAPIAGEILAVNIRAGEFVSTQGGGNATPFIQMGETNPLHVRIDIDENEVSRLAIGEPAIVSPRGAAELHVKATFVRAEPQVVPKRSLTNSAAERVDVRVLQLIYALPPSDAFRVGQQIDAFIPAKAGAPAKTEG